jgi:hypothetical protein
MITQLIKWSENKIRAIISNIYPAYFTRPMTKFIRQNYGKKDLVGVEIGVLAGLHAETMLLALPIKKLYLVDPYEPYVEKGSLVSIETLKKAENRARERLSRFRFRTIFVKRNSSEIAKHIPDNLDFVYIDGNHEYEFVKADIETYYPKMKIGGVIGGHDFYGSYLSVVRAVMEFSKKKNIELHTDDTDWWFVKK